MHKPLETAKLDWRNATTPVSSHFGDVYFSADNGFAESRFVYLHNNALAERFSQLENSHFTIAETGFGTGLNFLLTWQCWRQHAPAGKKLYYISTECFPLQQSDLQHSLACWPELAEFSTALCNNYPLALSGVHCIELADGITLILLLGNATESLPWLLENSHPALAYAQHRAVDAWFLDGFAPDKNPDMWTPTLFSTIAKLSKRGTTFASFTAAGMVRRGLQGEGFRVEKVKGFGRKREMIRGEYIGLPIVAEHIEESNRARPYAPFWPVYRQPQPTRSVLVIGAGIAGFTTATLLADAGLQVTMIDSHTAPLQGASGNPQAMLFPKFSHKDDTFAEFNLLSYLYAQRFYRHYFSSAFYACGMLQFIDDKELANTYKMLERFHGMNELVSLLDASASSAKANTTINRPCLWLPGSGWIRPASLRASFLEDKRIRFFGNTTINSLSNINNEWHSTTATGESFRTDTVVLCNAQAANIFLPDYRLPTKAIRGQISVFSSANLPPLDTIVCHEGYIAPCDPQNPGFYTCGSSYDLKNQATDLLQTSQDFNINTLQQHLPDFSPLVNSQLPLQGRAEFRCSTNDYLPVIGPVPDSAAFLQCYKNYTKNSKAHIPVPGPYHRGLFVNIGHGSRGFSTAPMAAALIRAYVAEQPYPMPFALAAELNPARFLIRDIVRRKVAG